MVLPVDEFMRLSARERVHRFADDDYTPRQRSHGNLETRATLAKELEYKEARRQVERDMPSD